MDVRFGGKSPISFFQFGYQQLIQNRKFDEVKNPAPWGQTWTLSCRIANPTAILFAAKIGIFGREGGLMIVRVFQVVVHAGKEEEFEKFFREVAIRSTRAGPPIAVHRGWTPPPSGIRLPPERPDALLPHPGDISPRAAHAYQD